jgi:hypothetical protein
MPSIAEAKELDLTFTDAPTVAGQLRIEVVDAAGKQQWSATAPANSGSISVQIKRHFVPGDYFVRLYGPDQKPLHEYGFKVRP